MAVAAFSLLEGTEVHDALIAVREEDAAAELDKFKYDPVI